MKLLTESTLNFHYKAHLKKVEKIWQDLEDALTCKYVNQGYWWGFAREKAEHEVLELRSTPNNGID